MTGCDILSINLSLLLPINWTVCALPLRKMVRPFALRNANWTGYQFRERLWQPNFGWYCVFRWMSLLFSQFYYEWSNRWSSHSFHFVAICRCLVPWSLTHNGTAANGWTIHWHGMDSHISIFASSLAQEIDLFLALTRILGWKFTERLN